MTVITPKTWFVTGSSRGLGRAITEAALAHGDRVVATARDPRQLDDLAGAHPERLLAVALDVTDVPAVTAAVQTALDAFGRIDVVVNNAGYANLSSVEDTTIEDFHAQLDTNLFGVVNVTKAVLATLREQGRGHIVNVSSVGGRVGTPGLAAYQAAKWAVNGFTEVLAAEVRPLGIKVTTIEPGGMQTDWAGSSMHVPTPRPAYQGTVGFLAELFAGGGIRTLGDTAKVADVVLQLAAMEEPPLRLLLGSDALASARTAAAELAERDLAWEALSRSTDRDDATPAERDPLGLLAAQPVTIVRRFIDEVVNGGRLDVIDELWHADLAWHGGSLGTISGIDAFKAFMAANTTGAFTGMHLETHDVIAAGSKVVVRFTNSGTQTGPFMGLPPTGTHAEWLGIGIYTVTGHEITEAWFGEDTLGMLLGLGAITLPD